MVFNSLDFLLFACVVFPVYWTTRSWPARTRWLLVASWAFYASWSPAFLCLLITTTWVDFHLARWIARAPARRTAQMLVAASIAMNLGVLAFFKYGRFVYEQVAWLAPLPHAAAWLAAAAPLGISFYTFHSISYIVDTYHGLRAPSDSFA